MFPSRLLCRDDILTHPLSLGRYKIHFTEATMGTASMHCLIGSDPCNFLKRHNGIRLTFQPVGFSRGDTVMLGTGSVVFIAWHQREREREERERGPFLALSGLVSKHKATGHLLKGSTCPLRRTCVTRTSHRGSTNPKTHQSLKLFLQKTETQQNPTPVMALPALSSKG